MLEDTPEAIASMIDHAVLAPTTTDLELAAGIALAQRYGTATVCIQPCAVALAAEHLRGSPVRVCTVVGFPHGTTSIEVKTFEAERAMAEGAVEIDMVVNPGKVLSGNWSFVRRELESLRSTTLASGAKLKVIFETDFLLETASKVQLCRICSEVGVDWVKTSTGYGFVRGADGGYGYRGATEADVRLMREHCSPQVQIKASGGIRTLDDCLRFRRLGCTRIGASATAAILEEARRRFGGPGSPGPEADGASSASLGY